MSVKNKVTTIEKMILFFAFLVFAGIVVGFSTKWGGAGDMMQGDSSTSSFQFITSSKTDTSVLGVTDVSGETAITKVNINTATIEQLDTLPGIGEKKAETIIKYREVNGPFKRIEDIVNVSGIGEKNFEQLKDLITVK